MLVCNECYEIFYQDSGLNNNCPKFQCLGDLFQVDDDIAWHIATINQKFIIKDIPFRTMFVCSSHIGHQTIDTHAYIVFKHEFPIVKNEKQDTQITNDAKTFIEFLRPAVNNLNKNLSNIITYHIEEIQDHHYDFHYDETDLIQKVVVTPTNGKLQQSITPYLQNKINFHFKNFLIDVIEDESTPKFTNWDEED